MSTPYTIRRTKWMGRPAELLTFTGTTREEYDTFCDARFADKREPIGWRTDAAAPYVVFGDYGGCNWKQFRRWIVEQEQPRFYCDVCQDTCADVEDPTGQADCRACGGSFAWRQREAFQAGKIPALFEGAK